MKHWLILLALFIYAFCYQLTPSEYWPVTISKTWWELSQFEYSMLQKPLFSFILGLVHLLPMSDVYHIYTVKLIFSILGITSIWMFAKLVFEICKVNLNNTFLALFTLGMLVSSPTLLTHFFRIRSDQLTFLFFTCFLYFQSVKDFKKSFIFLLLIPITSIKSVVFLLPATYIFYQDNKHKIQRFRSIHKLYLLLIFLSVTIWTLAINTSSFSYLLYTFEDVRFPNPLLLSYLKTEFFPVILSVLYSLYLLFKKNQEMHLYAKLCIYFFLITFFLPQVYNFYVASVICFMYLPLITGILNLRSLTEFKKTILLSVYALYVVIMVTFDFIQIPYMTIFEQINYITKISSIISDNNLSYIDGMGVLPRQKILPCFVSPSDDVSNNACVDMLHKAQAESIFITGRLYGLGGTVVFHTIENNYDQILPNFWVRKDKLNENILSKKDLSNNSRLPLFTF